jgi:DNA ligase-1
MLAERVATSEEALKRMDGKAAAEYKLDGERIQIHKGKERIELFSRRLERITDHYPDVEDAIRSITVDEAILEGEVVAVNSHTDEFFHFKN